MEQFFTFQVRVNLLQQSITTLQSADTTAFQNIARDILTLTRDILSSNNDFLHNEYMPQIEQLCLYLNNKLPFLAVQEQLQTNVAL